MNRHFEIPKNDEDGDEKSEKPRKMSRREFLKCGGSAAALALLPFGVGLFAETPRALSKEVNDGDSWEKGIRKLRGESIHGKNESSAFFITDKKGVGYWKHFAFGDEKTATLSGEKLSEEFSKDHEDIKLAHTHPLQSLAEFGLTEEDMEKIRNGTAPAPAIPLSTKDITEIILFQSQVEGWGIREKTPFLIVDPRGMWEYTADTTHLFAQEFVAYHEKSRIQLEELRQNPTVQKVLIENPDIQDSADLLEYLQKHEFENLPQRTRWLVTGMLDDYGSFTATYNQVITGVHREGRKHFWDSFNHADVDPKELLARYKRDVGITATFTSYKDLGIE